jgi:4-aminobutyrate aminotransferase-like enzyme
MKPVQTAKKATQAEATTRRAHPRTATGSSAAGVLQMLQQYESQNITYIDPDGNWPLVWNRARGMYVWDLSGRRYLDLTAAFGVAASGHANQRLVRAAQQQFARLGHAMGDVHPHPLKARLVRELSHLTFERWSRNNKPPAECYIGKTILCNSGFEAVEAALKTALLATGKRGVIGFECAYHGLGYGALNATHRSHFREPFQQQLGKFGHFAPFPTSKTHLPSVEASVLKLFETQAIGAVLVEPVQGRGGIRVPPPAFLPWLRKTCDQHHAVLILDEIYTGFGRTGAWFACEHTRTTPDLICLGKALTGGFPLSACVGRADLMDTAWPPTRGEAIHTSTFLGHPVGCAMALAQIDEIEKTGLVQHAKKMGDCLADLCQPLLRRYPRRLSFRGLGLMAGIEVHHTDGRPDPITAFKLVKHMLRLGFILLPEGEHGSVISITPPLLVTRLQLQKTLHHLEQLMAAEWPD